MAGRRVLRPINPPSRRFRLREVSVLVLASAGLASLATPWLLVPRPSGAPAARADLTDIQNAQPPLEVEPIPVGEAAPSNRSADDTAAILAPPTALIPRTPSVEVQASSQPYLTARQTEPEDSPLITSSLPDRLPTKGFTARRRDVPQDGEAVLPRAFKPSAQRERSTPSRAPHASDREALRPTLPHQEAAGSRTQRPRQTAVREPSRGPVRAPSPDPRANWNLPNSLLPIRSN